MTRLIILFFAAIAAFAQQVSAPSPALTWAGGATAPVFSATPTFDLALALRWQPGAMTSNVTSVTFTNKVAGMRFSVVWTQDGTGGRTVTYGASASGTCAVSPTLNVATTQQFEIAADGTTVLGVGCTNLASAAVTATNVVPSAYPTVTDGSPITWALASASVANGIVTLINTTGTRALNITNPVNGGFYTLLVKQDATGGALMTLGSGCTWKVINGGAGAVVLSTAASAIDILTFTYDGVNCYAALQTNFN